MHVSPEVDDNVSMGSVASPCSRPREVYSDRDVGVCGAVQPEHRVRNVPDRELLRGGGLRVVSGRWGLATWNVEGLTEVKVEQLQLVMARRDIGLLCIQETHRTNSDYFVTDASYLVIFVGHRRRCR